MIERGETLKILQLTSVWLEKSVAGCNWMKNEISKSSKESWKLLVSQR